MTNAVLREMPIFKIYIFCFFGSERVNLSRAQTEKTYSYAIFFFTMINGTCHHEYILLRELGSSDITSVWDLIREHFWMKEKLWQFLKIGPGFSLNDRSHAINEDKSYRLLLKQTQTGFLTKLFILLALSLISWSKYYFFSSWLLWTYIYVVVKFTFQPDDSYVCVIKT